MSRVISEEMPEDWQSEPINYLTKAQLKQTVDKLKFKGHIRYGPRGWFCTLVPSGTIKHAQVDVTYLKNLQCSGKRLVHRIWWRYTHGGQLINPRFHISHLDAEYSQHYLACVEESKEMNESRKYCHFFHWYAKKPGEDRPRCPHWERPCTGPNATSAALEFALEQDKPVFASPFEMVSQSKK